MFFSLIHEIGHIVTALILKIKPEKIEIMPFGLSVSFYKNVNDKNFNIKELFVALAGPLTSLILAIVFSKSNLRYITIQEAVYSNILILLFNLIPIYPLDGGRIIKYLLLKNIGMLRTENLVRKISKITIIMLTIVCSIAVYYYQNFAIFLICIFLWIIVLQEKNDKTLAIFQGK